MLAQAKALEQRDRVGRQNLRAGLSDTSRAGWRSVAHDLASLSRRSKDGLSRVGTDGGGKPDLARAALHLVCIGAVALGQCIQSAAELDDVAVAIVPLIEQRKVVTISSRVVAPGAVAVMSAGIPDMYGDTTR